MVGQRANGDSRLGLVRVMAGSSGNVGMVGLAWELVAPRMGLVPVLGGFCAGMLGLVTIQGTNGRE